MKLGIKSEKKLSLKQVLILSVNSDEAGAPRHCEILIRELAESYSFIFVTGEKGPVFERLEAEGFRVIYLENFRNKISPLRDVSLLWRFYNLVKAIKPDLIHAHSSKSGVLARFVGSLTKTKVVYTVHGFPWRGFSGFRFYLIYIIELLLAKIPNIKYILVSRDMKGVALNSLGIPPLNINIVPNGVPDTIFAKTVRLESRTIKIVMPARVCAAKDHLTLFKAFVSTSSRFELVLCGDGTDAPSFIAAAKRVLAHRFEDVTFLGQISNVDELLNTCDILVLSSHFEALPLSIIEGMRAGLPVIATNVGGVSELVTPETGFLFEPGDFGCLSRRLLQLQATKFRNELGAAGRLRYIEHFSSLNMSKKVSLVYESLLS